MLIHVQYVDKRFDYVNPPLLDDLLETDSITGFRRSSGWVTIGIDPVRKTRRSDRFMDPDQLRTILNIGNPVVGTA